MSRKNFTRCTNLHAEGNRPQSFFGSKSIVFLRGSRFSRLTLLGAIFWIYWAVPGIAGSEPSEVKCLDGLVSQVFNDGKHVLTAPLHWKQNDLVFSATLSCITYELMILDTDFQESVQRNRTFTTDRVSEWTSKYTKRVAGFTIVGLYLAGLASHDQKSKRTALLCFESVALSEEITTGLKYLIGRSRPFGNKGAFDFHPLKSPPPPYSLSFPSGHATTAFALSSVIAAQYRSWMVRLPAYGFAMAVALGRVNNNVHFVSDVFWGGIIGTAVGRCLVKFHRKDEPHSWSFSCVNQSGKPGIGISFRWK
ncbi:MAG: phosphatase PAP2 family protein [Candidatus Zixiibacteriota bacterium]